VFSTIFYDNFAGFLNEKIFPQSGPVNDVNHARRGSMAVLRAIQMVMVSNIWLS